MMTVELQVDDSIMVMIVAVVIRVCQINPFLIIFSLDLLKVNFYIFSSCVFIIAFDFFLVVFFFFSLFKSKEIEIMMKVELIIVMTEEEEEVTMKVKPVVVVVVVVEDILIEVEGRNKYCESIVK